jgi:hypothetical protein
MRLDDDPLCPGTGPRRLSAGAAGAPAKAAQPPGKLRADAEFAPLAAHPANAVGLNLA